MSTHVYVCIAVLLGTFVTSGECRALPRSRELVGLGKASNIREARAAYRKGCKDNQGIVDTKCGTFIYTVGSSLL